MTVACEPKSGRLCVKTDTAKYRLNGYGRYLAVRSPVEGRNIPPDYCMPDGMEMEVSG